MKKIILIIILHIISIEIYSQSEVGDLRDFQILKNNDTLVLNRRYGAFWGGVFFGWSANMNFGTFNLPRNYDLDRPYKESDSLVSYPFAFGLGGYHAGFKFEYSPIASYWGLGADLNILDFRNTISQTAPENDVYNTSFISNLTLSYITFSPYLRYNFNMRGLYLTGGLDFETKYSSVLKYRKNFESSQSIDHDRIIVEEPNSFRMGVNFGIAYEFFSGDINKRIRMRINPYANLHAGTNIFSEFKSSLNQIYLKVGVAIKLGPDMIMIDTLKWDSTYMPPANLIAGRSRIVGFPGFDGKMVYPDSLSKIVMLAELSENPTLASNEASSIPVKTQPTPVRKQFVPQVGQTMTYQFPTQKTLDLNKKMKEEFIDIVDFLKANPGYQIEIIAHSGQQSGVSVDERTEISKKRAENVQKYFLQNGLTRNRIITLQFKGSTEPKFNVNTNEDLKNNRVEIRINPPTGNQKTPKKR